MGWPQIRVTHPVLLVKIMLVRCIWTKDQFDQFIATINKTRMRIAFELLFYSGIREGELLALFPDDFTAPNILKISKNYSYINGKEMITGPKTQKGNRSLTIPNSLYDEVQQYISMLYGIGPEDRIFEFTKNALYNAITKGADHAGSVMNQLKQHGIPTDTFIPIKKKSWRECLM